MTSPRPSRARPAHGRRAAPGVSASRRALPSAGAPLSPARPPVPGPRCAPRSRRPSAGTAVRRPHRTTCGLARPPPEAPASLAPGCTRHRPPARGGLRHDQRRRMRLGTRPSRCVDPERPRAAFGSFTSSWPASPASAWSREPPDSREAIELVRALAPAMVLMDIRIRTWTASAAARRILGHSGTRVLVLTTFDADEYVYETLRIGASGFLLKDAPPEQLVSAVRCIAAGDALIDPSVTRRLIRRFARAARPGLAAARAAERAHRAGA